MAGATARQIPLSKDQLEGDGGGAYASIEVPGDYEVVLKEVSDYDYRAKGKSYGWLFVYDCETPTGGSVPFNMYLSFGENARWKLVEVLRAHGVDLSEGMNSVDPNALVGEVVGAHIDFPRNDDGEPTSKYREITEVFSLVEQPEPVAVEAVEGPATVQAEPAPSPIETYDPATDGEKFGEEPPAIV